MIAKNIGALVIGLSYLAWSNSSGLAQCNVIYPVPIQVPYIKAEECVRKGNLKEAEEYYAKALKAAPPDIQRHIFWARGDAYRQFNKPDLAIADYKRYSAISHENTWSKIKMALCYYDQKNYAKASSLLKSLPDTETVIGLKGRIAFYNGQYKEAFKDLDLYRNFHPLAPELRTKDDNDCDHLRQLSLEKLKEGGH